MRATVLYDDGTHWSDIDHVFTTGALDSSQIPNVQVSSTSIAPSPGIEMLVLNNNGSGPANQFQVVADNLQGQLIWYYSDPAIQPPYIPNPVKLLRDGSVLINYSETTSGGADSLLRDVDLAGNTKWQMSAQQLAQALATQPCFTKATVIGSSHDVAELPNGHLMVIVNLQESFTNLPGYPGTIVVDGDDLVDLDQNRNPAWCWSAFDHLDINRHGWDFPDWTHTNAVLYSPTDGSLIISMRTQNWLIKINYQNGTGDGSVLWHLGYQGDFALDGGTDPVDWFYGQHGPSIISDDGKGHVTLGVFDNGNDRVLDAAGDVCGTSGQIACYSRATVFQLDQNTQIATLAFQDNLPYFSSYGGNVEQLGNLDLEFDAAQSSASGATIQEITNSANPQVVWQFQVIDQFAYRGYRLPSLYPGVQW
jgi:arylsulfate sulfotransferase